jgi:hypothetical protein
MPGLEAPSGGDVMSQGNWGGGSGGWGGSGGDGGQPPSGGGYGPPGGAPPGGYGPPPGGYGGPPGGYGGPPGGGFAPPPAGYPPGYTPPSAAGAVAWEDANKGVVGGGWETFKEACFNPRTFFAGVAQSDNPWPAITFGMTSGAFAGLIYGVFVSLIYVAVGGMMASAFSGIPGMGSGSPGMMMGVMGAMGVFAIIAYPIMFALSALIGPWISGGIYHLMLMMLGGTTRPYTSTVRVSGYANASTLWMIVPGVGSLISLGFHLVLTVIGLDETHKCGVGKAVGAVLMPVVLFCGCCCVGYAMIFAAVGTRGHF